MILESRIEMVFATDTLMCVKFVGCPKFACSFITVDARIFTGEDSEIFDLPINAFSNLGEFTDEVYFSIDEYVKPYDYGNSWFLVDTSTNDVIKNSRMITGTKGGSPLPDRRSLSELGIKPGTRLEVRSPNNMQAKKLYYGLLNLTRLCSGSINGSSSLNTIAR